MYNFFILRAAPATGKSTWIEQNDLSEITVSSDEWRLELVGLKEDENGIERISQENQRFVWDTVRKDIEERMEKGEDVILDSCALKTRDMKAYDDLIDKYGYDGYVIEFFRDVDVDTCLARNANRPAFRQVPDYVIENFFEKVDNYPIPDNLNPIDPDEAISILAMSADDYYDQDVPIDFDIDDDEIVAGSYDDVEGFGYDPYDDFSY